MMALKIPTFIEDWPGIIPECYINILYFSLFCLHDNCRRLILSLYLFHKLGNSVKVIEPLNHKIGIQIQVTCMVLFLHFLWNIIWRIRTLFTCRKWSGNVGISGMVWSHAEFSLSLEVKAAVSSWLLCFWSMGKMAERQSLPIIWASPGFLFPDMSEPKNNCWTYIKCLLQIIKLSCNEW